MSNVVDNDGARIGGFTLENFVVKRGKKEDDPGTIRVVLEASKDEINAGPYDLGDVLKAMNVHQEGEHPVVLRVLMTTDAVPSRD